MQGKVKTKLFNLFAGELSASILFIICWALYLWQIEGSEQYLLTFPTVYAFLLLEFILLQGSIYWYLKWKQVKDLDFSNLPKHQLRLFTMLKYFNVFFLSIGMVMLFYQIIAKSPQLYFYLFLLLFALVEYINYFHIRLSYMDTQEMKELVRQKGFRPAKLAKELKSLDYDPGKESL